jgi:ring-1,2-phenylacetyl-CoA epoxidase subunit PaaC
MWLGLAGEVEGKGQTADNLAFLRDVWDFRNLLLIEMPNGDFGQTLMRQFLFDAFHSIMLGRLMTSSDQRIADIAAKASKEVTYHLERSAETVVGLGDGTEESHARMQAALDYLWPYVGEMFQADEVDAQMAEAGIAPDPASLRDEFDALVGKVLAEATLTIPDTKFGHKGGKTGAMHTEHLGHLLTQMQWLQRAYPGATW